MGKQPFLTDNNTWVCGDEGHSGDGGEKVKMDTWTQGPGSGLSIDKKRGGKARAS
jgi:hypothetical protein